MENENDPTIDLWCVFLDGVGPAFDAACRSRLALNELDEERRFAHVESRRQFLAGRALLRTVLARYVQCDPRVLEFQRNRHGKPRLSAPVAPLEFSISHASGLVVCAIARRDPVGVDVEQDRDVPGAVEFARRFFVSAEAAALARMSPERQNGELLRRWTLKEALAKARGTGLGNTRHFVSPPAWPCLSLRLAARYHLALAVARPGAQKPPVCVWTCGREKNGGWLPFAAEKSKKQP